MAAVLPGPPEPFLTPVRCRCSGHSARSWSSRDCSTARGGGLPRGLAGRGARFCVGANEGLAGPCMAPHRVIVRGLGLSSPRVLGSAVLSAPPAGFLATGCAPAAASADRLELAPAQPRVAPRGWCRPFSRRPSPAVSLPDPGLSHAAHSCCAAPERHRLRRGGQWALG